MGEKLVQKPGKFLSWTYSEAADTTIDSVCCKQLSELKEGSYPCILLSLLLKNQPSSKKWTGNLHTRYSDYTDYSKTWSFNSQLPDIPLGGAKYIKKHNCWKCW